MRKSKEEKKLDALCEKLFYVHGNCRPINIMKIGSLFSEFKAAVRAGEDGDAVMIRLVEKFCDPVVAA